MLMITEPLANSIKDLHFLTIKFVQKFHIYTLEFLYFYRTHERNSESPYRRGKEEIRNNKILLELFLVF